MIDKLFAFFFALLLAGTCPAQTQAQPTLPGFPPGTFQSRGALDAAAAASYAGPGDAVSGAQMFWSCSRAYTAAYASGAGNACDIQRTSDNATCTTKFATSGYLDQTTAYCTSNTQTIVQFCNATTCGVKKAYDQSGQTNCNSGVAACDVDDTAGGQAAQPTLSLSCLNSKPCFQFVQASSLYLQANNNVGTLVRPYTLIGVAKSTGSPSIRGTLLGFDSNVLLALDLAVADNAEIYCGTSVTAAAADASWHALLGSCSALTSSINVDGANSSSSVQTNELSGRTPEVGRIGAGQFGQANVTELGVWPVSFLDSSKNTIMCQNMQTSYGSGNFGAAC